MHRLSERRPVGCILLSLRRTPSLLSPSGTADDSVAGMADGSASHTGATRELCTHEGQPEYEEG